MTKTSIGVTSRLAALVLILSAEIFAGTSAQAADFTQADLYNPAKINLVELNIPAESVSNLNDRATAKTYTAANVTITSGSRTTGPLHIGIPLKGNASFQLLNDSASFKLQFNWGTLKRQRLAGLKNMTLNAMTQDGSKLHEFASYKLFNAMNVPAPRTGWAIVKVNGVTKGLYANIETYDDIFLASRFKDSTQHLYEANAFYDLRVGNDDGTKDTGHFPVKKGWSSTPNKADLTALIAAANTTSTTTWWTRLGRVSDRSELIRMWAVENFIGHWDGYSGPIINNHFWRSNTSGKFVLLPWGTDQTFGENRQTSTPLDDYFFPMDKPAVGYPWVMQAQHVNALDRGMLFRTCLTYKPCKTEYLNDLKLVSTKATSIKLVSTMKTTATVIKDYTGTDAKAEQVRTELWVAKQQSKVAALLKLNKIK